MQIFIVRPSPSPRLGPGGPGRVADGAQAPRLGLYPNTGANGPKASLGRDRDRLNRLDPRRTELELRDLAHGIELRVGEQIGGSLQCSTCRGHHSESTFCRRLVGLAVLLGSLGPADLTDEPQMSQQVGDKFLDASSRSDHAGNQVVGRGMFQTMLQAIRLWSSTSRDARASRRPGS